MKAIINLNRKNFFFSKAANSKSSNWLLNIANKPYLEYLLDFCIINNATDIIINQQDEDSCVRESFNSGEKWGIKIRYTFSKEEDNEANIINKNKAFIGTDSLIFVNSGFFLNYDKNCTNENIFKNSWKLSEDGNTVAFCFKTLNTIDIESLPEISRDDLTCTKLENTEEYFKLSISILSKNQQKYFLPGYSNEANVLIGENVEIPKSAKLVPPIAIGDNVQIKGYTQIGPNVVVGDNSIIDKGTFLSDSIVYSRTYVGSNLDILHKIFYGNTVISPETGETLELVDKHLGTSTADSIIKENFIYKIFSFIYLIILSIILCIPYLLFKCFKEEARFEYVNFYTDTDMNKGKLKTAANISKSFFYRFMLDKFINFPLILSGKVSIIGNTPVFTDGDTELVTSNQRYFPGLISYTEILNIDKDELLLTYQIHEFYYSHNKSLIFDFKILCKFFIRRLFLG